MTDQAESPFYNKTVDRVSMRRLISKLVVCFGVASTTNILDQVKVLGFQQATKASVSSGIDDLLTVPSKGWLVQDAENCGYVSEQYYRYGSLHAVEKLRQSIEAWYATSECSKREMNPNFKMIDPLNPVHMMSFSGARGSISQVHQLLGMRGLMSDPRGQVIDLPIRRNLREGLSLTEYIISRYGARKGVVDTAVRTSDAGYLTRRLVEVVQHIVVREKDCGTIKSIALLNVSEERRESIRTISYQRLVGRVLADNVYWDVRCVATRNQDISDRLASNLATSAQPIYVRSTLTCKSIFWICQLCYGWSLANQNLVELGEAVGIIAGQSIGEPGTQLTLRTFHTGGVFTGDIAEYIRIPFNGVLHFDERLVRPTRTRHGHPAWMCRSDLPIFIKSCGEIHNFLVPAQSLLIIQNGQYVEAQQIIAEVRAQEFPLKERIQKSIYPNLEGEIHWSKFVRHVCDSVDNPNRVVREAGHIWILSGDSSDYGKNQLFHKDQDRISTEPRFVISKSNHSKVIGKKIELGDYEDSQRGARELRVDTKYLLNWSKFPTPNSIIYDISVRRDKRKKPVSLVLEQQQEKFDESCFTKIYVQLKKILDKDNILAFYERPEHQTGVSGVLEYGTIKVKPIQIEKNVFVSAGKLKKTCGSGCKVIEGGSLFLIPEEYYIVYEPLPPILVTNHTIAEEGAQITGNIFTKLGGLIQINETQDGSEIKVLPGYIYNLEEATSIASRSNYLVASGNEILRESEYKNWVYIQPIRIYRKRRTSVSVRPVVEYSLLRDFSTQVDSCPNKPETKKCVKAELFTCIFYRNGERVEVINHTTVQLIQTCLVTNWQQEQDLCQTLTTGNAYVSLISVGINNLFNTFPQIDLLPPHEKSILQAIPGVRVNRFSESLVSHFHETSLTQIDLSNNCNEPIDKYRSQSTFHSVSERGKSFLIVSPLSYFRNKLSVDSNRNRHNTTIVGDSNDLKLGNKGFVQISGAQKTRFSNFKEKYVLTNCKNINFEETLTKCEKPPLQFEIEGVGLIGTSEVLYQNPRLILNCKAPIFENCFSNYSTCISRYEYWYLIDETRSVLKYPTKNYLNKCYLTNTILLSTKSFSHGISLIHLGLLITESRYFRRNNVCIQSGQVVAIYRDYLLVRTGKPFLATQGATPQKTSGDIVGKGDTLMTLPYDRLRSGDITQGLPKIEQLLESRSVASITAGIEDLFDRWSRGITRLVGTFWGHFLSAGISMEHCRFILIDQIRKVYESQGVQVSDKHLEIIVKQLTSRVAALEGGTMNVSLPGELVELSQAERLNRVLKRPTFYVPILLGMTKASLSTTSFLSEASLQETTRVLAKAALRGRIDRLKGLKENVIPGDTVPIGTGSQEIICQLEVDKQKKFHSAVGNDVKNSAWEGRAGICGYCKNSNIYLDLVIQKGLNRFLSQFNV
uniref:DNA-directed RNA polymerase subunit beta'' n=1 Tax=Lindsaea linearis TaxID=641179 RepID=A0A5B9RLC2_9MONI|nr:RNA polymerase beta'' subunit [Lindsaea linearis]QEG57337.1 RNA polymerase beta'' subunit [Lindsaea linearis]